MDNSGKVITFILIVICVGWALISNESKHHDALYDNGYKDGYEDGHHDGYYEALKEYDIDY